mgnify:CR=1 FL=1
MEHAQPLHLALPKGVTSGYRPIKDGTAYDALIPEPDTQDRIIIEDGEVTDTVKLMGQVVARYLSDTAELAPKLKGRNVKETCFKVWSFLYHHIQYRLDEPGLEQLRRPARSWAERKDGIDCDCFSIFCSSVLTHLGIPHRFRIAKYDGGPWQHVYVVAGEGHRTWIIDPVLSAFDYEKPFTDKRDFPMDLRGIDIAVLSGPSGGLGSVEAITYDEELMAALDGDLGAAGSRGLDAMLNHLKKTRAAVAANPAMVADVDDPEAFLKMLDYAIRYWNTDRRDEALAVLADNERQLNARAGVSADMAGELGAGGRGRAFFQKVGDFAKKVGRGVSNAARSAAQVVMRINPVSVASRGGFLLAMKLNIKQMASRLKWGYASESQAAKNGISRAQWQASREALQRVEKLFADKLQGRRDNLKKAILEGKAGGLQGELGTAALGEPVTVAAAMAAAAPVIIAAINILKDTGLIDKNEKADEEELQKEAAGAGAGTDASLPAPPAASPPPPPAFRSEEPVIPEAPPTGGAMTFLKNNPVVAVAGAGALALGVLWAMKKSKKPPRKSSLSGPRTTRRKTTTTSRRGIQRLQLK